MLGIALALIFLLVGIGSPLAGRDFAVFYLLFAVLAAGTGDCIAVMLEEGFSGLRSVKRFSG